MNTLEKVLRNDCCAGCGLCASLSDAVTMKISEDGFLRPVSADEIDAKTDRLIADVCPGNRLVGSPDSPQLDSLWGPVTQLRSGHATDTELRHAASSGGGLSAVLGHLMETGQVDRVLHVRASAEHPLENDNTVSADAESIKKAAGSRYVPSAPLAGLVSELGKPGTFALVGKPCDIAAARALARHDPRVDEKIPVMLSFFCAGVPSIHGARTLLDKLGVSEQDVVGFRYRGNGWPGRATATLKDGRELGMSYEQSWGDVLSKHVQLRCKICPDATGEQADVVFADAWLCDENGYPLLEEEEGRSLIVARTDKGKNLIEAAEEAGRLSTSPMEISEIAKMQPSQAKRRRLILSRLLGMRLVGRRPPTYRGMRLLAVASQAPLRTQLRNLAGMSRRLLRRQ